jgi:hypothetical protein
MWRDIPCDDAGIIYPSRRAKQNPKRLKQRLSIDWDKFALLFKMLRQPHPFSDRRKRSQRGDSTETDAAAV